MDFVWAKTWSGTPLLFSSAELSFHKYPLYSIFKSPLPGHSQPFRAAEAVRRAGTLAFSLSRQHNLHSSSWGQSGSKFGIEAGVVPWDTPPTKRFLSPIGGSLARWLRAPRLRLSTNFAHGRLIKPTFSDPFSFVLSMARLTELARKVRSRLAIRGLSRGVQFAWSTCFRLLPRVVLGSRTTSAICRAKSKKPSRVRSKAVVLHASMNSRISWQPQHLEDQDEDE